MFPSLARRDGQLNRTSHVSYRSSINLLGAEAGLVLRPSKAKVGYLGNTVLADKDVPWLEIPVDDVQVMEVSLGTEERICTGFIISCPKMNRAPQYSPHPTHQAFHNIQGDLQHLDQFQGRGGRPPPVYEGIQVPMHELRHHKQVGRGHAPSVNSDDVGMHQP